jgi:hypothetical protein
MTRRRVLCGLLLVSVVLGFFAGWLVISNHGKMTRARFEQVKKGMSLEDVIRTVGGSPVKYPHVVTRTGYPEELSRYECWVGDDAKLVVYFDHAGMVMTTVIVDGGAPRPTLTQRFRGWLGL